MTGGHAWGKKSCPFHFLSLCVRKWLPYHMHLYGGVPAMAPIIELFEESFYTLYIYTYTFYTIFWHFYNQSILIFSLPGCLYTLLRVWEMALRNVWQQSSLMMLLPPCGKKDCSSCFFRKIANFYHLIPSLLSATTTTRSISQQLKEMSLCSGELDVWLLCGDFISSAKIKGVT